MSARSLIQKIKQFVGLSDRPGSESDARPSTPEETDVTVEREPESTDGTAPDTEAAAEDESDEDETEPVEEDAKPAEEDAESVEKIKGIGPTYRERLEAHDLGTVPALAESDAETVAEVAETTEGRAAEWVKRANNR